MLKLIRLIKNNKRKINFFTSNNNDLYVNSELVDRKRIKRRLEKYCGYRNSEIA